MSCWTAELPCGSAQKGDERQVAEGQDGKVPTASRRIRDCGRTHREKGKEKSGNVIEGGLVGRQEPWKERKM